MKGCSIDTLHAEKKGEVTYPGGSTLFQKKSNEEKAITDTLSRGERGGPIGGHEKMLQGWSKTLWAGGDQSWGHRAALLAVR